LGCLFCLAISLPPRSPYSYQIHRDAFVVFDRKNMHIVPWDQIQALVPEVPFFKNMMVVTRDGHELPISTSVRNHGDLVGTILIQLRERLLPRMFKRANAGRMVEFGPYGVSSYGLMYKGQTTSWDDITKMVIVTGQGACKLLVYRSSGLGVWPFIQANLQRVP